MGNGKMELDDENLSLSQRRFIRIFARTGDLAHAAAKCFPEKDDPVKYASKVLNDTQYRRSLIEYHCDKYGVTDEFLVKSLRDGIDSMHWNDPKSAKTKLDIIKEIFKLKGRYPEDKSTNISINQNNINNTVNMDSAKEQVLSEIWERTQKNLSPEQIKGVVIEAKFEEKTKSPVNSKKQLFLKDNEAIVDEDVQ